MLTLTKASIETKLILKWGAASLIGLIILFFVFKGLLAVKEALFPTPPPKPTVVYGRLPQIVFPQEVKENYNYTINTISGNLPKFNPSLSKVYRMKYIPPDLLALQRAQKIVAELGFKTSPFQLSSQLYEWTSPGASQKHLKMNIVNFNFTLSASLSSDPDIVSARLLPNKLEAARKVKSVLSAMGLLYDDIDDAKTKTEFLRFNSNNFSPASSFSQAQLIKVDLFQKDIDGMPIYYEKIDTSSMDFLVGGGQEFDGQIVGAQFSHQTPSSEFGTYPLKTAVQAFEDLKSGKGYVSSYFGTSNNIPIKNVFLAFYMSNSLQGFLMPIIVFQGDDGFYGYVSAVTDEWISK